MIKEMEVDCDLGAPHGVFFFFAQRYEFLKMYPCRTLHCFFTICIVFLVPSTINAVIFSMF